MESTCVVPLAKYAIPTSTPQFSAKILRVVSGILREKSGNLRVESGSLISPVHFGLSPVYLLYRIPASSTGILV